MKFVQILQKNAETCRKNLRPELKKRREILDEYAGDFYKEGRAKAVPLNLVSRAFRLLVPSIVAQNPKVMIRPRILKLKPFSETFRLALNHFIKEIKLGQTLRNCVFDALSYMGIIKMGICDGGPLVEDAKGILHDAGQIYADRVSPEDYFFDLTARKKEDMDFEGDIYELPLRYIQESGIYKNYDKLVKIYSSRDFFKKNQDYIKNIKNIAYEEATYKDYVKVQDIFLPAENLIMTIPLEGQGDKPLRVIPYEGPENGPYRLLRLGDFPDSIIPPPPIWNWLDLYKFVQEVINRIARRIKRGKSLIVYDRNSEQDANVIRDAEDMELIGVDNVDNAKEIEVGKLDYKIFDVIGWFKNLCSEQAGNLDMLAGLKAQANTLGQEQMLYANATTILDDMIQRAYEFTQDVLMDTAWYVWHDPFIEMNVTKRIAGLENIQVAYNDDAKEGDFWEYNVEIEPYSMARMSPTLRMRRVMELVSGLIIPTLGYAAQQGDVLNVRNLVKTVARDMDLTESEIDSFYQSQFVMPTSDFGPYMPTRGKPAMQPSDQLGASPASRELNSIQQQNRAGMKPSPPNKKGEM